MVEAKIITDAQTSTMQMVTAIGSGIGKVASGPLIDTFGGRVMALISIAVRAILVATFMFDTAELFVLFVFVWGVINFTYGFVWASYTKIASGYPPHRQGLIFGVLALGSRAGVTGSLFLFAGMLLLDIKWQLIFLVASGAMVFIFFLNFWLLHPRAESDMPQPESNMVPLRDDADVDEEAQSEGSLEIDKLLRHPLDNATWLQAILYFLTLPDFWLIGCIQAIAAPAADFYTVIGNFFKKEFNFSPGKADAWGNIFTITCAVSAMGGGIIYDQLRPWKRLRYWFVVLLAGLWLGSTAALYLLADSEVQDPVPYVIAFGTYGLGCAFFYYIPFSLFSIKHGGRKYIATVNVLIDTLGYAGDASFFAVVSKLLASDDKDGADEDWKGVFLLCLITASVLFPVVLLFEYRVSEDHPCRQMPQWIKNLAPTRLKAVQEEAEDAQQMVEMGARRGSSASSGKPDHSDDEPA
eukprot:TRINITY_DN18709_c0_g1_i1.p1 TRINITY_DN18709_c0_g1~~TRINITY_DN18709_c0_g1_i1.p1  ORF type:complete len:467 (-),score=53.94 TRINITY_DN18709_c0_g1_i1:234-1634(-)